ncbi:3',5'-cyclic adenosine monophosphate phosphodiesterase CpdA [Pseudolysinimonas kribbensis]|uniref:3',5'-cyclic adenosine monophosphate phosphodiesterase CpdA n=2 Tax=Pseudolysinimonas kribbensis TaxID=433641 RepID=A0ABQ6K2C1_9MICO|nr:3',5'-cyclic adenosine monophosphate phosphodiesterase CpdA [Pseudolysinimonas kribbensis]
MHGLAAAVWFDGSMLVRDAEYPRPDHTLIHISDTHLLAGAGRLYDRVDAEAHLRDLMARLEATGRRPDALVFTGDLADLGEPEAYARLRGVVEPVAARLGSRIVWAMGNHDDREAFRAGLLDGSGDAPVDQVIDLRGLRIITLDTSVPGAHHGELAPAQLDWLREQLAAPAPDGTILALHHPPIPSVLDLAVSVELRDQPRLARVLRGTDVRAILGGHLHYSSSATFAGIPVSVASASCYTQDLLVDEGGTQGRDGARSFNLVQIYPDTVLHAVVPLQRTEALSHVGAAESTRRLAALGLRIPGSSRIPEPSTQDDDSWTRPIDLVGAPS